MKSTCGCLVLYFLCSIIVTSLANENRKYLVELGSEEKVNESEIGQDYADDSGEPNEDEGKVGIHYADSDEDESNSKDDETQIGRREKFGAYVQASDWIDHLNQHSIPSVAD